MTLNITKGNTQCHKQYLYKFIKRYPTQITKQPIYMHISIYILIVEFHSCKLSLWTQNESSRITGLFKNAYLGDALGSLKFVF